VAIPVHQVRLAAVDSVPDVLKEKQTAVELALIRIQILPTAVHVTSHVRLVRAALTVVVPDVQQGKRIVTEIAVRLGKLAVTIHAQP
jgi:hypothetical protein